MTTSSSFLHFLNHWWNLPFLVLLALVAIYFVLQLVGLAGHEGDAHDASPDGDGDGSDAWHSLISFLGGGRVPFMVVWVTLFIFVGFAGLIFNRVVFLNVGGQVPAWLFPVSLASSLAIGLVGVRLVARLAARFVDVGGNGSTKRQQLIGKLGVVASATLDARFGEVRVHDGKDEILVHGRLQGEDAPLARGARVVVIDYDSERELYWVASSPDIDSAA